jgi:cell division protein FtsI/penicillin-binding protein 2
LGVVLSEEECRILSEGMVLSAGNAGLLPGVYAKTGTAETGSAGSNNIWMTGYFDSRDTSYAFCVMAPGADATGSSLGSVVNELAKFMN